MTLNPCQGSSSRDAHTPRSLRDAGLFTFNRRWRLPARHTSAW